MPAFIMTVWASANRARIAGEGCLRAMTSVKSSRQVALTKTLSIIATRVGEERFGSASFSRLYLASAQVKSDPS